VLGYFNEDIKAAIASIDRSLAFNPSSARAWRLSGFLGLFASEPERGGRGCGSRSASRSSWGTSRTKVADILSPGQALSIGRSNTTLRQGCGRCSNFAPRCGSKTLPRLISLPTGRPATRSAASRWGGAWRGERPAGQPQYSGGDREHKPNHQEPQEIPQDRPCVWCPRI
jgi:hypothetical protein